MENNLTQQEVAHHSDISVVTLRKLVNETGVLRQIWH